eukprot:GHUV01020631.1.p2 GENE.GHUV01020631.1~~GHUV01020631.1.p2  ORF type:complete len:103 (-),score=6.53 GHUV01020631.1:1744-2052(-)
MTIAAVPLRRLGSQGLVASAQGLGCMGMTYSYTNTAGWGGDAESIDTVHRALELGVNFLDTSDIYGPFTNEELVGEFQPTPVTVVGGERWCPSVGCAASQRR